MSEDNVENLRKSFDIVGAIHPIIIDNKSGKIVTGKSREKTGKSWPRKYKDFSNPLEIALFQAAENLNRRVINYDENKLLLSNIQLAQMELNGKFFTQSELANKIQRSESWVKQYWDEGWTHVNVSGKKAGIDYDVHSSSIIDEDKSPETYENYTEIEATNKLLQLKKDGDDNPTNKIFNDVYKQVPAKARLAYTLQKDDTAILEAAKSEVVKKIELDAEPVDVRVRREYRNKICQAVIDEFKGHELDVITIFTTLDKEFFSDMIKSYAYDDEN